MDGLAYTGKLFSKFCTACDDPSEIQNIPAVPVISFFCLNWMTVQKPSESTGVYKIIFSQDYTFPIGAKKLVISREAPVEQDVGLGNPVIF